MATLGDVLGQVRDRIERSRSSRLNEQNTKGSLIEPVLRALGWDVEDWEEVQREFKVQSGDNPVDYALMDRETKKALLFLEAKALGENLDDRKWAGQIMGYAHVAGVKWVILTNGDEYRIYNAYAEGPVEDKIFRKTCISDEASGPETALALLSKQSVQINEIEKAWQTQFVDQKLQEAVEALFLPTPDHSLVNLIRKRIPELQPADIRAGLQRVGIRFEPSSVPSPQHIESSARPSGWGPVTSPAERRREAALKSWETRRAGEPSASLTERNLRYVRFWEQLLARAREAGVTTHAGVAPSREHWLHAGAGKTGFGLEYLVGMRDDWAAVELYIDTQQREQNKRIFDLLHRQREQIEAAFGAGLDWQRMDEKRASRIRFLVQEGGVTDESRWPQLQDNMISAMERLSATLQPYIRALPD